MYNVNSLIPRQQLYTEFPIILDGKVEKVAFLVEAIVFSYLDDQDAETLCHYLEREMLCDERYPFHKLIISWDPDIEEFLSLASAKEMYKKLNPDDKILNKPRSGPTDTPATHAFNMGYGDLTSFFLHAGGNIFIGQQTGNNLYWDHPMILKNVMRTIWENRKENPQAVQNMLNEIAKRGHLICLELFIQKLVEDPGFVEEIDWRYPIGYATRFGFYDTVVRILQLEPEIGKKDRRKFVDSALEMGYPKIARLFEKDLTPQQQDQLKKLEEAVHQAKKYPFDIAPKTLNKLHSKVHGGDDNARTYEYEYKKGVFYARYYIATRNAEDKYKTLLENLGFRRRRMAILGGLKHAEEQGECSLFLHDKHTPFGPTYPYAERVQKKYGNKTVKVTVAIEGEEEPVELTWIRPHEWIHPMGLYGHKMIRQINRDCFAIERQQATHFRRNSDRVTWDLAHADIYKRGTPTITYMLQDAFAMGIGLSPINKNVKGGDLNCEALVYDKCEEFLDECSSREDFFLVQSRCFV